MEHHFGSIPDYPFQEAVLRYGQEKQRQNANSYVISYKYRLQVFLDRFGDLNVADITPAMIQDYADERIEESKLATVQKELAILKAILNKARREGRLMVTPTFPRLKKLPGRTRWLTPDEEKRLLAASASHLRPLIAFAVDTGGRRSELLRLDWRQVDLERNTVTFTKTKNGEDRSIRLTDRARETLQDLSPKDSGPVFTYGGKAFKEFKNSFDSAREKAGLEDFRFHDLRHTFASRLVQKGIPLYEVMHLTGHKTLEMVQRYSHLAPDYQARAIAALNSYGTELAHSPRPESAQNGISA
ncbi:MAG: tyrosine-type recombinase/integrase [Rhodospirillales bacterium]